VRGFLWLGGPSGAGVGEGAGGGNTPPAGGSGAVPRKKLENVYVEMCFYAHLSINFKH
jgi:hypothetical protein